MQVGSGARSRRLVENVCREQVICQISSALFQAIVLVPIKTHNSTSAYGEVKLEKLEVPDCKHKGREETLHYNQRG